MTLTDGDAGFGTLVKTFRRRRRRTQQHLADALGVHRSTLFRWERGDYLPESKAQILELARCLTLNDQETRQLLEASLTALSPSWHIPFPRNPYFTGREEVLETLHSRLGVDQAVALTQSSALHGLGGVGKTQIALEYAYQYALEYHAVFWIGAETEEHIASSFLQIAETLQLPEREGNDQQCTIAAVQRWLGSHGQWLLIWDNIEDLALFDRFLPSTRSGAILLTTRRQALGPFAWGLDLLPMEREEGILFLLRRVKVLPPAATGEQMRQVAARMPAQYEAAEELVTLLGSLPLALDQAGAYVEETQCGLPAYLALFRTRHAALLQQRGEQVRDHPASVFTTFHLSMTATTGRHPAAADLLQMCALLQPDAIPEELFLEGARYLGATLEAACCDILEWNQVAASACAYSLLHRQPKERAFSMHRLVQAVLKSMLPEAAQQTWRRRVLGAMSHLFPADEKEQADYWQRCERLLPHALLCLTWSEEETLRVALMHRVASYFSARSRFAEAEALFQQALRLGKQGLGTNHPQIVEVLSGLAFLCMRQGRYTESETHFQRALRLGEHTFRADHSQVSEASYGLAVLYGEMGRYAEAEPLYQKTLSICEHTLGADHPRIATVLQGLAALYNDLGRYAEAEALYQRALGIRERTLGADHSQVATVLNNLAATYLTQERYAETEPLLQRALHIWEQTLGPEHHRVGYPLLNLAEVHRDQGRYARAEQLLRRALHIWERAHGPEHPDVALALDNLALLLQEQGEYTEVEALFQRALSIREQQLDPQHPDLAQTLHDLALFRQQQGKPGEARSLAERALSIRSQALGDTHPQTIATRALHAHLSAQEDQCAQEQVVQQGNPCRKAEEESNGRLPPQAGTAFPLSEIDSFEKFLGACCELHPRASCRSADLWRAYEQWVKDRQERFPLTRGAFIIQVKRHGCRADRTMSARIWRGIALGKQ